MKPRAIQEIDADLRRIRTQVMDSVKGSVQWTTAKEKLDRLLDERLAVTQHSPQSE
jgi:hypothetical protein